MKKTLALLLCLSLAFTLSLSGCKGNEKTSSTQSNTPVSDNLPTVNVGVINDKSAISMTYMLDMNSEAQLEGNYVIKMYSTAKESAEAFKNGEIQVCTFPLATALDLSENNNYIYRIAAFNRCYDYGIYTENETKLSDLGGKQILAYGDNCVAFLKAFLNAENISATVIAADDTAVDAPDKNYAAIAAETTAADTLVDKEKYKNSISLYEQNQSAKVFDNMYTSATLVNYDFSKVSETAFNLLLKELKVSFSLPDDAEYLSEVALGRGLATNSDDAAKVVSSADTVFSEKSDLQSDLNAVISLLPTEYSLDATLEKLTLN